MRVTAELAGGELLPALATSPGHLLWRAAARVSAVAASALPPGIDVHAYAVLVALKGDAVRSQQDLADGIATSRTTMSKVAGRLATDGLVERVRNPEDRRSYALTRTPAGAQAEAQWRALVVGLEDEIAPTLGVGERAELAGLLRRVAEPHLAAGVPHELLAALGFVVVKAHMLVHRDAATALAPLGVEPRHLGASAVLRALGPVPQVVLARALGVTPASTVPIVDDMERLGLVERRRAPGDRRTHLVHVADGAAATLREAAQVTAAVVDRHLAPLTPDERDRLVELLARFVTAPLGADQPPE